MYACFVKGSDGFFFKPTQNRMRRVAQVRRVSAFSVPVRFFPRRDILVVGCRGALKGRLRVRAKGQAHRYSCLIETALHRRAACLRTTGFSMEDV